MSGLGFDEYWTGLVFNGHKIGFTHLEVATDEGAPGGYRIRSEAAMRFHFLGVDKRVALRSEDRVGADLRLVAFDYDFDLDGSRLRIEGEVRDDALEARIRSAGGEQRQRLPLDGPVYPASAIALYPVLAGLGVGASHHFTVYDGETQQLATVDQEVLAYQASELFEGEAFKVHTRMQGHEADTWIDAAGRPLLETSMGGVFIAGLETEAMARRHLALAALNKEDSLLEFSRVAIATPVPRPREVRTMTVALTGLGELRPPDDSVQRCRLEDARWTCSVPPAAEAPTPIPARSDLASTLPVPSRDPRIRELAESVAGAMPLAEEQIAALVEWIQSNVEQEAVDVFSALDVLRTRKAECQGNTYLYAAMARALSIPTRVVNGLVYSEIGPGFLYHTWAESYVDGRWVSVDATFGQAVADATHVKLVYGETLADLGPMVGQMGRIEAEILKLGY